MTWVLTTAAICHQDDVVVFEKHLKTTKVFTKLSKLLQIARQNNQNIHQLRLIYRSSRPEVFCEKGVLRNFAKFTGQHLCQSLFY